MFRVFRRSLNSGKGIWTDFSKRSESLKVQSIIPKPTQAYHAPLVIDDTFQQAYKILEEESQQIYSQIDQETDIDNKNDLLIKAETNNPEVLYNLEYNQDKLDITQPIYRRFLKQKWQDYDLMILMQRLEQLKVIPDTLPTLEPTVDVRVKFPHITNGELNRWITPGEVLPSFLVKQPPMIKITQFDNIEPKENNLFTVVIVNPDDPNLATNQFKTTLNYGISNVSLSLTDDTVGIEKYLDGSSFDTFKSYVPLVPEVNAGDYQRACLWVFKQNNNDKVLVDLSAYNTEDFNLRDFVETHSLTPVGAHVWRQKYDRSVNDVRNQYGLPKGRVFHRVRKPYPVI